MNIKTIKQIDVSDWDALVTKTYGRPYSFQQQDGCKERQSVGIKYALLEIDRGQNLWLLEELIKVHSAHEVLTEAELKRINKLNL